VNLKFKESGKYLIVYLRGQLDVQNALDTEKELSELLEKFPDRDVILNLQGVEFMSSSGIRVLVYLHRVLKEKKKNLKLCDLSHAVRKVFQVIELMDMFAIFETEEEAAAS